jgi:hypothetical protein
LRVDHDAWDAAREEFLAGKAIGFPEMNRGIKGTKRMSNLFYGPLTPKHKLVVPDNARLVGGEEELILSCRNHTSGRISGAQLRMRNPREFSFFISDEGDTREALEWVEAPLPYTEDNNLDSKYIEIHNPEAWNIDQLYKKVLYFLLRLVRQQIHTALGFNPREEKTYLPLLQLSDPRWTQNP